MFVLYRKFGLKSVHVVSTERNKKILNFLILMTLVVFMGSLSLLNFSCAFLISIFYVPTALVAIAPTESRLFFEIHLNLSRILVDINFCKIFRFLKFLKSIFLVMTMPIVLLAALFLGYSAYFNKVTVFSDPSFIGAISKKLYNFAVESRVSHVWTISLFNIFLIPIWSLLWFTIHKRS